MVWATNRSLLPSRASALPAVAVTSVPVAEYVPVEELKGNSKTPAGPPPLETPSLTNRLPWLSSATALIPPFVRPTWAMMVPRGVKVPDGPGTSSSTMSHTVWLGSEVSLVSATNRSPLGLKARPSGPNTALGPTSVPEVA